MTALEIGQGLGGHPNQPRHLYGSEVTRPYPAMALFPAGLVACGDLRHGVGDGQLPDSFGGGGGVSWAPFRAWFVTFEG